MSTASPDLPIVEHVRSLFGNVSRSVGRRPWEWSWTHWHVGDGWTLFWIVWVHAWGIAGLLLFPIPPWPVFLVALAFMWIGGLGTTVAYHRAMAHKALTLHPVVEFLLIAAAIFNGSGAPATWTANHRLHHAKVETPDDISSPRIGGFWWSHFRWLYQAGNASTARWAPEFDAPRYHRWSDWQLRILGTSFLVGLPFVPWFGWAAFFWIGPVRLIWALNAQCFVNSVAHMRRGVKPGEDSSQNLAWLGILHTFQGENWHGNHHANPSSARLGWRWYQLDVGWYVVCLLERLRLAWNVRRPRHAES